MLKKKKQLNGLLRATSENQSYATALNHGVKKNLEDVISNKWEYQVDAEKCVKK